MRRSMTPFGLFAVTALAMAVTGGSARAQSAAVQTPAQDPKAFLDDLAARAFALLRDRSVAEPQRRAAFRAMLRDNFALKEIGDRLIRRHRAEITPAQYAAYQSVFPGFVVGAYADKLEGFSDAKFQTIRSAPHGGNGTVDVFARVTVPGKSPLDTVWAIKPEGGRYLVSNMTVSGINLALTQEADFSGRIQQKGFDSLVQFMRERQ